MKKPSIPLAAAGAISNPVVSNPLTIPTLPGTVLQDGEVPRWWLFDSVFVKSLSSPEVRGVINQPQLNDIDKKTLSDVLIAIKSARAQIKSSDNVIAREGAFSLVRITGYLVGFLEAKRLPLSSSPLTFLAKPLIDPLERDGLLGQMELNLTTLIYPTRGPAAGALAAAAAWPYIALTAAAGVAAKLIAASLPD